MVKFQKPFIDRPGILDPKPGDPHGYCTNDGMYAAVPYYNGKNFHKPAGFSIIHNGSVVKDVKTYTQAVNFIKSELKKQKSKRTSHD